MLSQTHKLLWIPGHGYREYRRLACTALNPAVVYSTDRSSAVVPVLVLLFVALWLILRGDLFYVLPCVILFLCFSVLLALRLPRLGKRELILVLFIRLFDLCLFGFVGFLFLLVSGKGCGLWLWHSLDFSLTFYTPPHNSGGVLWFHVGRPWVRPSVRPSIVRPSVRFSFPDDNLSKHQWIFTKLGMCIDIVEIWLGIANGQISSIFDGVTCPRHAHIFVSGWLSIADIIKIWFRIVIRPSVIFFPDIFATITNT